METAIIKTLCYHALFDYPLTDEEIHRFLISPKKTQRRQLQTALSKLVESNKIVKQGRYYFPGKSKAFSFRRDRNIISSSKIKIATQVANLIAIIPWISFIGVTGALAMNNAAKGDDIDLMIITARDRLWLTRPLVVLLISLFFKRRKPTWSNLPNSSNLTNSICLNLWLDESNLLIPASSQNLYTAHELVQIKPLINNNQTYEKLIWQNRWLKNYLANTWSNQKNQIGPIRQLIQMRQISALNNIAFKLQLRYMLPRITTERVSLHGAFFHPGNRGESILQKYKKLQRKILKRH